MPFDRMVRAVDNWAARQSSVKVFAQIGDSDYQPRSMEWVRLLEPDAYKQRFLEAELIVSHAGMGTVISAAEYGKPLLVLPRRGDLRETRNDHQVATAKWLEKLGGIRVAMDETMLEQALDERASITLPNTIDRVAPDGFIAEIRKFIRSC